MLNVLVNKEYEKFFGEIKSAAPDYFFLELVDFSLQDQKLQLQLSKADAIIGQVKKYIFTKFITSSITGVSAGLIYWFLGLELAFIFGSLTFILNVTSWCWLFSSEDLIFISQLPDFLKLNLAV